jgi:hypothetical protein
MLNYWDNLIGLDEERAEVEVKNRHWIMRVVQKNKQSMVGTCDLREDRVNVVVNQGVVTEVMGIG